MPTEYHTVILGPEDMEVGGLNKLTISSLNNNSDLITNSHGNSSILNSIRSNNTLNSNSILNNNILNNNIRFMSLQDILNGTLDLLILM